MQFALYALLLSSSVLAARVPFKTSTTSMGRKALMTSTRPTTSTTTKATPASQPSCASPLPTYGCLSLVDQANWQSAMLNQHNSYRARHDAPAMTWNTDLAAAALSNAQSNSAAGTLAHTSSNPYGENIGSQYGYNNPAYIVYLWYDEINKYDYSNPGFSSATGHFTQLVWTDSTQLGCAYVQNQSSGASNYGYYYIACEYKAPGNVEGQYAAKVNRPNSNPAPTQPAQRL